MPQTIGGVSLSWDENSPPVTESAGLGASRMESIKSTVRTGLEAEHIWPSAGGSNVGAHAPGSARPFFGPQSNVSSTGSDGRVMFASDTSRFFHVGSGGTCLIGAGPTALSVGSMVGITFPQRAYLVEEFGQGITSSSGSTLVTFPNSGFSGIPFTFAQSVSNIAGSNAFMQVAVVDGATVVVNAIQGGSSSLLSGITFFWRSVGTRTL